VHMGRPQQDLGSIGFTQNNGLVIYLPQAQFCEGDEFCWGAAAPHHRAPSYVGFRLHFTKPQQRNVSRQSHVPSFKNDGAVVRKLSQSPMLLPDIFHIVPFPPLPFFPFFYFFLFSPLFFFPTLRRPLSSFFLDPYSIS